MTALDREKQYIRKWRPKAVRGDSIAMSNVAAAYRILGNLRLAARWYRRASERRDGDALTEWGYCLQHGVGIRKDRRAAERAYRAAIGSKWITDFCREEAMYHLAVLFSAGGLQLPGVPPPGCCVLPVLTGTTLRLRLCCRS